MFWNIIHIIDIILWLFMAASVLYVAFFAIISLIPSPKTLNTKHPTLNTKHSFLLLYPAYNEDKVIVNSVKTFLKQTYDKSHYDIAVISDHMSIETNTQLSTLPITLLQPTFEKSSKAKALQYAMSSIQASYDYVVILDADNIVDSDFLEQLNTLCNQGYKAIQCHRCAKNNDNDIAALDGVSEEINNTLFRSAHNTIGMSSALIGSGMCFDYKWFANNVPQLSTAGEDRELEAILMMQKIFIKYANTIHVFDEKVNNGDNFQRQRLRWMTAQIQALLYMLPNIPKAVINGNINYIDKTIQQALIPRSILIIALFFMATLMLIAIPVWAAKWWILFTILILSLIIAMPAQLRTRSIFKKITTLFNLTVKMLRNIRHIKKDNNDFLHTTHG